VATLDDAWSDLYDALPPGWEVGQPPFDAAANRWRLYSYERRLARRGRVKPIVAESESHEVAVRDLTRQLREIRRRR
jgi:hypothetical protein